MNICNGYFVQLILHLLVTLIHRCGQIETPSMDSDLVAKRLRSFGELHGHFMPIEKN